MWLLVFLVVSVVSQGHWMTLTTNEPWYGLATHTRLSLFFASTMALVLSLWKKTSGIHYPSSLFFSVLLLGLTCSWWCQGGWHIRWFMGYKLNFFQSLLVNIWVECSPGIMFLLKWPIFEMAAVVAWSCDPSQIESPSSTDWATHPINNDSSAW